MKNHEAAAVIWDFLKAEDQPTPSDSAFVFGGWNIDVARRAAKLQLQGFAPTVLVSGNRGKATADWAVTESERFADEMVVMGVPTDRIILEKEATNSLENTVFGMLRLEEAGFNPDSLLLVGIPFMMRRCKALFAKHFPHVRTASCPPLEPLEYYRDLATYNLYERLLAELERLESYPEKGFFDPVAFPPEIVEARLALSLT